MKRIMFTQRMQRYLLAASLAVSIVLPVVASTADKRKTTEEGLSVKIKNFGKVNDHIYRGEQPEGDAYRQLVSLGIKTIVDLRSDKESWAQETAEKAGLRYINLPLEPKGYPKPDAAQRFLAIVTDPANGPVYVHCAGGRHRTGVMLAVYRLEVDGWDIKRTYKEMKDYDFYTRFGHGCYKEYIYDYGRSLQSRAQAGSVAARTAVTDGQQK